MPVVKENFFCLKSVPRIAAGKLVEDGTSGRLSRMNGCKAALQNELVEVCHVSCQTNDPAPKENFGGGPVGERIRAREFEERSVACFDFDRSDCERADLYPDHGADLL